LPSVRDFARTMGVSPSTVVEAYDRLVAEGLLEARRGAGFYVRAAGLMPLSLGDIGPARERDIDPLWVARQSLDADMSVEKPGCGWLPPNWLPETSLRRALRRIARSEPEILTDYGSTRGAARLRWLLLGRFAAEGLIAGPEQLMLTGSGTQAADLVCRYLLRPGDRVLVDDPGYFNFHALLRAHQVKLVGLSVTPTGPDPDAFEAVVRAHSPRLYITNSALQNPTGASLSPATAHRILRSAAEHDLTILEDDIFADFEPGPSPRLAVLDGFERVIRIGSFSKSLSASVRCGYIAGRADWIADLVDLQVATSFGGASPLATAVIAEVVAGGGYRKHLLDLHGRLAGARERTAGRLGALGIAPWLLPRGGFYLWCKLPGDMDAGPVARRCLAQGVVLAPGNVFSVSQSATSYLRFNVAHSDSDRVEEALRAAMATEA